MAVPCLAVAAEEHVIGGVEEQEMCARAGAVQRIELFLRVGDLPEPESPVTTTKSG